ncbi:uncharacterized protein LOC116250130 isoform X2 [Nymphaea colorata]|uniref:uncharacterized protein LOC116250130 isoform X2 n=1 Tax=Nymphaea colorata TaxID=210225 RepID=UPI00214EACB2|nr:uncharacterized protein LOC116250130 isoform X2 [Nymphaea colorata]
MFTALHLLCWNPIICAPICNSFWQIQLFQKSVISRKHEIIIVRINLSNDRFSPYDFVIKDQRTNKILLRGPKKRTLLGLKEPATTKYEQLVFTSQGCNPL